MSNISKKAALAITNDLDRLAQLFEANHITLGVPKKVAVDFAYRCDLLSDFVEKQASLERDDKHSQDTVKTLSEGDEFHEEQTYLHELGDMTEAGGLGKAARLANILAELLKTAEEDGDEGDDDGDDGDDGDEEAGKKASDDDEEADDDEADDDDEAGKKASLIALAKQILRVAEGDDEEADEDEADDEEAGKKATFDHGYNLNA